MSPFSPVMLELSKCILPPQEDRCVQLYDAGLASELASAWLPPLVADTSCIPDLHVATKFGLTLCPPIAPHEFTIVQGIHVYTDGSGGTGGSDATWGFCVIASLFDGSLRFVGSQAGRVTADSQQQHWLGCESEDSMAAELSALFWAIVWALFGALRLPCLCEVTFNYDNLPVGSAIFHGWTLDRDAPAQAITVAVRQVLETVVATRGAHVHSHEGNPWNELADRCCAAIRPQEGEYARRCAPDAIHYCVVRQLARDGAQCAQWLYIHFLPSAQRLAYPVDADGWVTWQRLSSDLSAATPAADIASGIDQYVQPGDAAPGRQVNPRCITVASYNALTVKTKRQKDNIARQLAGRRIHVCGIQESRDKTDSSAMVGDYIVVGSASNGRYGCQVWVSTALPFATDGERKLKVKEVDLAVLHADPRLIVVRSLAPALRCLLVSMHAPHHGHPAEEVTEWWQAASVVIARCSAGLPVILMMDANADIAKHRSGKKTYAAVPEIEALCVGNALDIPAVNDDAAPVPGATQTTFEKDRVEYTIDYIACSTSVQAQPRSACAIADFDTNGFRDHLPTVLSVVSPTAEIATAKKRRIVAYDRRGAQHPTWQQQQRMEELLAQQPVIPHWVDTTSHQYAVDTWMQAVLCEVFPKRKKPPRPPEMSQAASDLCDARGRVHAKARFLGREARRGVLRRIVAHWRRAPEMRPRRCSRKQAQDVAWHPVFGLRNQAECLNIALLHLVVCDLNVQIETQEQEDRAAAVLEQDAKLVNAIGGDDTSAMFNMTRRMTSTWVPRVAPSIFLEDGSVAHGFVDTKRRWRRHFADLMDGTERKLADIIDTARGKERHPSFPLDLSCVPTNQERVRRMRKYKLKAGIGEDKVGTEILKLNNMALATSMAAITLKGCLRIDLPIQAKGGHIVELFKGKGSRLTCGNFRDITLGHVMSKPLAACMRHKAYTAFAHKALDTQFGALRGRGTELAHLSMRAAFDSAAAEGKSIAGVFIDVERAFARLCRALVLPAPESDKAFVARLVGCGYSPEVIGAVLKRVRDEKAWRGGGGSPHLQALLTDMHTHTWASTEFLRDVIELQSGTLAGNALGDLVFTAAMALVLKDVRRRLREQDLMGSYSAVVDPLSGASLVELDGAECEATDTSYVDDTFVPVIEEAPKLLAKAAATLAVVDEALEVHGFTANYSKGKTEVVIAAHGKGATILKQTVAHDMGCVISFVGAQGVCKSAHCVPAYKHLGSKRDSTESMATEVKARCATIAGIVGRLRARILANDSIPRKPKANILKACLLSRVLFNAGTWPTLTAAEYTRLHTCILKPTRSIAASIERTTAEDIAAPATSIDEVSGDFAWLSDQQVYELTGTCAPFITLVRLRVLLLLRVQAAAPHNLRCALAAAAPARRSWVRTIGVDLQWLATHTSEFAHWVGLSLVQRVNDAAADPKGTRRRVNLVAANAAYSCKMLWATSAVQKAIDLQFPCRHCDMVFTTRQAVAVHNYRVHGMVRDIRRKVNTHFCVACLQLFGSVERVVCHLREKAARCMATYIASMPDLDDKALEVAVQAAAAEARACVAEGRKRHFAATPAIRLCGPHSLCATRAGIHHARLLRDGHKRCTVQQVLDIIEGA